ncbi:prolyl 3-hydroxylase OGFOD1 isoform X2 [Anoplophora glabripennis]|uniref:prolyl 3-hydroxylase OGFOD1 isoform X2 n=1 Tax=Anoplophora glabripennis TaxID=217634 RepID=UPI0008735B3A|nr:prolyl 3-hydroxylase OGFOD1 isoform X2 [Anoplophora glabripennis]
MDSKTNSKSDFTDVKESEDSDEYESGFSYQEESSESEPELECDLWDDDCKIIPKTVSSFITDHLMPTCGRCPDIQPKKKQKIAPELNPILLSSSFMETFRENWNKNMKLLDDNIELINVPFKVCVVNNLIDNVHFLECIRQEFYELDWNIRNMDLYEFFQSKDLKYLNYEYVTSILNFLKTDVMNWVANLTGLNLTHISATCSLYSNTDYLLVHDDQREDRLVAFVLYLSKDWSESNGGALQLFNKDECGHPLKNVRSIYPSNNQLVFFPVTNDSYHQVEEVTSLNNCRLSINGWFHTKYPPIFQTPPYKPLENGLYSKNFIKAKDVDIELVSWINEDYLEMKAVKLIQKHIEENSEISLRNFFKKESFNEIVQSLNNKDICWVKIGPLNRYCYEVMDTKSVPHTIERFISLFQSTKMFSLLQKYTDLDLAGTNASMKFELQRWTPGCYSLLTDYNWQEKNELDLIIYFGCSKASDVIGARTQYVTIEDEIQNALITLDPEENNLNVVYRDSARFTKYFGKQSKCQCFYTLICSYSE